MILGVIDRIYQFFECNFFSGEQPDELKLPNWIKVSRQRFDAIKSRVENAKKKTFTDHRPNRKNLVTSGESNELLQDIEHCKIRYKEAVKKLTNILNDINMSLKLNSFTPNQSKMINILFMVDKVFTGISKLFEENNEGKLEFFEKKSDIERKESDEQPDTTDMPE